MLLAVDFVAVEAKAGNLELHMFQCNVVRLAGTKQLGLRFASLCEGLGPHPDNLGHGQTRHEPIAD
jgi:hypothetical protein